MKRILLLFFLTCTFSYSQVTDENGVKATGANNTELSGKIIIGNRSIGGNDGDPNNNNIVFDMSQKHAIFNLSDLYLFANSGIPWEGMYMTNSGTGDIRLALGAGNESWSFGIDNSDGDKIKLENDSKLSDTGYALGVDNNNNVDFRGNIGIGVATPSSKLHLQENSSSITAPGYLLEQVGTGDIYQKFTSPSQSWSFGIDQSSNNDLIISRGGDLSSSKLRFSGDGHGAYWDLNEFMVFPNTGMATSGISVYQAGSGDAKLTVGAGGDDWTMAVDNSDSGKYKIAKSSSVNSNVALTIDAALNIGIGTSTPDEKLSVNGTVHSKEVRVDLVGWPDYVFEEGYDLSSIEKVEEFIKENGHLEGIPSAAEVEANGAKLGEMNKLLLQKIEELTLYVIELNKEIESLKSKVD